MQVRFFKDQFNARFVWGWGDDGFVTSDPQQIENYRGLGLRFEIVPDIAVNIGAATADLQLKNPAPTKRGRPRK